MIPEFDDDRVGRDQEVWWEALDELMPPRDREDPSDMFELLEQEFGLTPAEAEQVINDYLDNYFDELAAKHEEEYSTWSDGDDLNFYCEP